MGQLLLVRHGQASFGADDYDVLSPTGWEQGRRLGAHLAAAGESSRHDPRQRRCALSSVTSFEMRDGLWTEIGYAEPAQTSGASDVGAV